MSLDLIGRRFGRLLVTRKTDERERRRVIWECACDCGNIWRGRGDSLLSGATRSCGCFNKEKQESWASSNTKHGASKTRLYSNWKRMKQRCSSPKHPRYTDYGGRGIKVCPEWFQDYQSFYDYVSKLPHFDEPGYTLDRLNNDGNYEPGNVRWATAKEQAQNKHRACRKDGSSEN